ncbi:hypothetical protein ROSINTL182_06442 [Roseburia intestinalis L1-82]|uniref:Uncharacterized protein n=1 Tax=Roseburia intestinalis L1-82 TaxID=536231 RepID=C7G964_9FIRM|nr:hypothetical protein ROSINTL182_06442 [Roseburia intestinalis L1-82]
MGLVLFFVQSLLCDLQYKITHKKQSRHNFENKIKITAALFFCQ